MKNSNAIVKYKHRPPEWFVKTIANFLVFLLVWFIRYKNAIHYFKVSLQIIRHIYNDIKDYLKHGQRSSYYKGSGWDLAEEARRQRLYEEYKRRCRERKQKQKPRGYKGDEFGDNQRQGESNYNEHSGWRSWDQAEEAKRQKLYEECMKRFCVQQQHNGYKAYNNKASYDKQGQYSRDNLDEDKRQKIHEEFIKRYKVKQKHNTNKDNNNSRSFHKAQSGRWSWHQEEEKRQQRIYEQYVAMCRQIKEKQRARSNRQQSHVY